MWWSRDSRSARDGRFIERLGFYNPIATESEERVRLDTARIDFWQARGAKTSPAVTKLIKSQARAAGASPAAD